MTDLSRHGVLLRREDDADRRRRIIEISPKLAPVIENWLGASFRAWAIALENLTPNERWTVVQALRDYEIALDTARP